MTETDANSATTTYRYDVFGRLVQVMRPYDNASAPTTVYTYTDNYSGGGLQGLKVEVCQREVSGNAGACQTSLQFYDGLGRLVQSRAEDVGRQVVVNTRYDALGRTTWTQVPVTETTTQNFNPNGWDTRPGTTTQYDVLGRIVAVTNPDGTVVQTGYVGMTTVVTDANGHRKDSTADAYGRLQAVVEYSGTTAYTTRYAYDVLGNLRVVTDALNNTTVITYDSLSHKVGMNDPDMGVWSYAYDLNGNLTMQTDAKGQTAWFGYDALNRLTQKRQSSSTGTVLAQYAYDQGTNGIGHRTAVTNANASTSWVYDARGRVATEAKTFTDITGTFGSIRQYDALDRVTQTRLPNGEVVTTTYNAAGQAASLVAGGQTLIASATYNALGQPQTIAAGNGVQTRYLYFGLDVQAGNNQFYGKVRQICVTTNNCTLGYYTGTLMNLAYWYDSVGNVTTLRDDTNQQKENFAYDPLDRLVSATPENIGVTTLNYTQTYAYNAIGNFVSKAGVTQVYGTAQPHAVRSLSDGSSFQYDANGNMTQRTEMSGTQLVTYQQQWDIDNHLVVVTNTTTGQVTRYFYDADGNRVKRIGPQGTTLYVNADYEVTGPSQMVTPTVTIPPTYTHKLYLAFVACASCISAPLLNLASARVTYRFNGQQVAVREGVTLTLIYGDHLGSASLTTNISGTKVSEMRYYPFGETRYSSGNTATSKRFTSQEEQVGIGLYDYGARFYDPILGRFISADSIVPKAGNPQSLNRYSYARNAPMMRIDPSGHGDISWNDVSDFAAGFGAALLGANISLAPLWGYEQRQKMADALFVTPGTDTNSNAYAMGRVAGDVVAATQGAIEMVNGGTAIVAAATGGIPCAAITAGACVPIAAVVGVAGAAEVVHGATAVGAAVGDATKWFAKTQNHHLATNKNYIAGEQWSSRFGPLFKKGGLSLDGDYNKVELPDHYGPHPDAYHNWVYTRLQRAIEGLTDKVEIGNAIKSELAKIATELQNNPQLVNNGPWTIH